MTVSQCNLGAEGTDMTYKYHLTINKVSATAHNSATAREDLLLSRTLQLNVDLSSRRTANEISAIAHTLVFLLAVA
jgi:hypothetical protein